MSNASRSNQRQRERAFRAWFKRFEAAGDKALATLPVTLHSAYLAGWRDGRSALLESVLDGSFRYLGDKGLAIVDAEPRNANRIGNGKRGASR